MDPEKKLTFCHGVKAEESTMSFQELVVTEVVPVSLTDISSTDEVVSHHSGSGRPVVRPKFCPGVNSKAGYLCETGHCCGETGCCTYYYELWWFWLLWTVLILFSCFCAYRHRRTKLRIQQQQRQREINLIAYNGACNYPSSMLDLTFLTSFKLPSYDEVSAQPSTPPPPYSSIFALQGGATAGPSSSYPHHHHHRYPCPPYAGPGLGRCVLTSSQSSDNYTSCSCESCSLTSPCSTSFSVQVTDETYDSSRISTPSEAGGDYGIVPRVRVTSSSQVLPDVIPAAARDVTPVQRCSSYSSEGVLCPRPPLSLPLHPHSSNPPCLQLSLLVFLSSRPPGLVRPLVSDPLGAVSILNPPHDRTPSPSTRPQEKLKLEKEKEDEEEEDEEDHFRHRRLTGDSGIEVCRCHVRREEELKKGKKDTAKERGRVTTMRPAVDDSVSDDFEQIPSSTSVVHRARDAIITLEL